MGTGAANRTGFRSSQANAHVSVLVMPTGTPGGVTGSGGQGGQLHVEKATATVVAVEPAADQSGTTVVM